MRGTHVGIAAAIIACVGVVFHDARAQGAASTGDKRDPSTIAANLAKEGRALLAKGQLEPGCTKLAESVRESAKAAVAVELASCLEKQGKRALAYRALEDALTAAQRERSTSQEATVRSKQKALEKQLAFMKLALTEPSTTVVLDGATLDATLPPSGVPLDPGSHTLMASAEGKKPWEWRQDLKAGQRETVTVPALEDVPQAAAAPPPTVDAPVETTEVRRGSPFVESAGRFVVELGALGGLMHANVPTSSTTTLDGLAYTFTGPSGGSVFAACGDRVTVPGAGVCTGRFGAATTGLVGGQAFLGWVLMPRLHVGLRTFGAASMPGGFFVASGPAVSLRAAGPLWVGLGGVVGFERHQARLVGANGSSPTAPGTVDVNLGSKSGVVLPVPSGVIGGATLEVAVALFGAEHPGASAIRTRSRWGTGSLLVGLWPSLLVGGGSTVVTVPGGLSYRFH
jgi:hypothetical protein